MIDIKEYNELVNWAEVCVQSQDCNECRYYEKCEAEEGSLTITKRLLIALKEYHKEFNDYVKNLSAVIFEVLKKSYKETYEDILEMINRIAENSVENAIYSLKELGLPITEEMK